MSSCAFRLQPKPQAGSTFSDRLAAPLVHRLPSRLFKAGEWAASSALASAKTDVRGGPCSWSEESPADSASFSDESCIEVSTSFSHRLSHPVQQSWCRPAENYLCQAGCSCSGKAMHLVSFCAVRFPARCPLPGRGARLGADAPLPCLPGGALRKLLLGRRLVLLHASHECRQSLLVQGLRSKISKLHFTFNCADIPSVLSQSGIDHLTDNMAAVRIMALCSRGGRCCISAYEVQHLLWGGVQLRQLAAQRQRIPCSHLVLGHSGCPVCKDPQALHIHLQAHLSMLSTANISVICTAAVQKQQGHPTSVL